MNQKNNKKASFLWKYKSSFIAALCCAICLSCAFYSFMEKQITNIQTILLNECFLGEDEDLTYKVLTLIESEIESRFLIIGIILVILASFVPILVLRFKRDNSVGLTDAWIQHKGENS